MDELPLGSVIYPKNITAEVIVRYVRALENASGNNVETLYRMLDGRVEAMEFVVRPGSTNIIGVPLQQLGLKKNLLVCSINRQGKIITPPGRIPSRRATLWLWSPPTRASGIWAT